MAAHLSACLGTDEVALAELYDRARRAARQGRASRPAQRITAWSDAPTPPAEVVSLLRAVRHVTDELPYRLLGPRRPTLTSVYVRQRVSAQRATARPDEPPEQAGDRSLDQRRTADLEDSRWRIAQPFDDVRDRHRHLLIEGAAGLGKSTLGYHVAGQLARAWLDADAPVPVDEPWLPVVVPARVLAEHADRPLSDAIAAAVAQEFGAYCDGGVPSSVFAEPLDGVGWFVVIDALDEIPDLEGRDRLLARLAYAMADPDGPLRFLITTRPLSLGETSRLRAAEVGCYELEPFDQRALKLFAEHWFNPNGTVDGHRSVTRFLDRVAEARLSEVLEVPLLAAIAALVHEQDPGGAYPGTRYELYERYLGDLGTARRTHGDGRADPPCSEADRRAIERGSGSRTALLERLAVVYTTTEEPLLDAAREHLSGRTPGIGDVALLGYLADGGLLVQSAGRLRFIHQTFAEHLAATAHARLLPEPFDPLDAGCADLCRGALQEDEVACRILLHYLHRPDVDGTLVGYLQRGTRAEQSLATDLILAGAPVADAQFAAFEQWVRQRIGAGRGYPELIHQLGSVARRPAARHLLEELAADGTVPDRLRIEAVGVLAEAAPDAARSARSLLDEITSRASTPEIRLAAGEALAKFGEDALAAEHIGALATDPELPRWIRTSVMTSWAELGDIPKRRAVALLEKWAADESSTAQDRVSVLKTLAELDPAHRDRAADLLMPLTGSGWPDDSRRWAAGILADFGGRHTERAATLLREMAMNPGAPRIDRVSALVALAKIRPADRDEAAAAVAGFAGDPASHADYRIQVLNDFVVISPHFRPWVADLLEKVAWRSVPYRGYPDRAARSLENLGPEYRARAAAVLVRFVAEGIKPPFARVVDFSTAAQLDPDRQPAATAYFAEVMGDPLAGADARAKAAEELAKLGPEQRQSVIDEFGRLGAHTFATPAERVLAARMLADVHPPTRPLAIALLDQMLDTLPTAGNLRRAAANALLELDARFAERVAEALGAIADDPTATGSDREDAAEQLRDLGPRFDKLAADRLKNVAVDPGATSTARHNCAHYLVEKGGPHQETAAEILLNLASDTLAEVSNSTSAAALELLGPQYQPSAAAILDDLAEDPTTPAWWRRFAADDLGRTDPHPQRAAVHLNRLAQDGSSDPLQRRVAAASLSRLAQIHRGLAAECLAAMVTDRELTPSDRLAAARELVLLGPAYRDRCAVLIEPFLRQLDVSPLDRARGAAALAQPDSDEARRAAALMESAAAMPGLDPADRIDAYAELAALGADSRSGAAAGLAEIGAAAGTDPVDRYAAAQALIGLNEGPYDETAARILTDLAGDPKGDADLRTDAATALTRLGAEARATAAASLQQICGAPDLDTAARLRAAVELARLGPDRQPAAAAAFERLATAADSPALRRLEAVEYLAELGPQRRGRAVSILREIAAAPENPPVDRATAGRILADLLPGYGHRPGPQLRGIVAESDPLSWEYRWAIEELAFLGVDARDDVTRILAAAATHDGRPCWHRIWAGRLLMVLGAAGREPARIALTAVTTDPAAEHWERRLAAKTLARLNPPHRAAAWTTIAALAADPAAAGTDRVNAAVLLARGGRENRSRATELLRAATFTTQQRSSREAVLAAVAFGRLSLADRPAIVSRLSDIAADERALPASRIAAAAACASLQYSQGPRMARFLSELMTTPGDTEARVAAALGLRSLDGQDQAAVDAVLSTIAEDQTAPNISAALAAAAIAGPDQTRQRAAATRLDQVTTARHSSPTDREAAIEALHELGYLFPGRLAID